MKPFPPSPSAKAPSEPYDLADRTCGGEGEWAGKEDSIG